MSSQSEVLTTRICSHLTVLHSVMMRFIFSCRTPVTEETEVKKDPKVRSRPLYDIPFMYEAREFMRTKLIGKRVNVLVDYVQPPSGTYPEKTCCTVTIGGM